MFIILAGIALLLFLLLIGALGWMFVYMIKSNERRDKRKKRKDRRE